MLSFKGTHFPKDVILYAVFFYVRYGVSYRDLEEIMEERGVTSAMIIVLLATLLLLLSAGWILRIIGKSRAGIISRVMGLILATVATVATEYILSGLKLYFQST
jgi:small neutral amino acid transporter SnatA (MarC family)